MNSKQSERRTAPNPNLLQSVSPGSCSTYTSHRKAPKELLDLFLFLFLAHKIVLFSEQHNLRGHQKAPKQLLAFFFFKEQEIPLFHQQCNAHDVENSKPAGHCMTTTSSVSKSHSSL